MPKRHGKVMQQLLQTMADIESYGLGEEQHRLSTAQRKYLREYVRSKQQQPWDCFFRAGPRVSDDFLPGEMAWMEERYSVSDEGLVARMQAPRAAA